MRVVVDANIFLSIIIPDSTTSKAEALLKMWKKADFETGCAIVISIRNCGIP